MNFKQYKYLSEGQEEKDKKKVEKELEEPEDTDEPEEEPEEKPRVARSDDKPADDKVEAPKSGNFASDAANDNVDIQFDDKQAEIDAERWLTAKYGEDLYTFKRIKGMSMDAEIVKVYSISVGDNAYSLNLRKYDGVADGSDVNGPKDTIQDVLGYDVLPGQEAPEIEEPEEIEQELEL